MDTEFYEKYKDKLDELLPLLDKVEEKIKEIPISKPDGFHLANLILVGFGIPVLKAKVNDVDIYLELQRAALFIQHDFSRDLLKNQGEILG